MKLSDFSKNLDASDDVRPIVGSEKETDYNKLGDGSVDESEQADCNVEVTVEEDADPKSLSNSRNRVKLKVVSDLKKVEKSAEIQVRLIIIRLIIRLIIRPIISKT